MHSMAPFYRDPGAGRPAQRVRKTWLTVAYAF